MEFKCLPWCLLSVHCKRMQSFSPDLKLRNYIKFEGVLVQGWDYACVKTMMIKYIQGEPSFPRNIYRVNHLFLEIFFLSLGKFNELTFFCNLKCERFKSLLKAIRSAMQCLVLSGEIDVQISALLC